MMSGGGGRCSRKKEEEKVSCGNTIKTQTWSPIVAQVLLTKFFHFRNLSQQDCFGNGKRMHSAAVPQHMDAPKLFAHVLNGVGNHSMCVGSLNQCKIVSFVA
jgi:hypothetical protein